MQGERAVEAFETELRRSRADWERRLGKIRADRRHEKTPPSPDSADRAIERENDEALDALDEVGREALHAIDRALDRIARGTYGNCLRCGDAIQAKRLEASPSTDDCIDCARRSAGESEDER